MRHQLSGKRLRIRSIGVYMLTTSSAQPDAKTRRYDRQLRLWASSGQSALESARILVLGVTATSTASLKNLILPGIGSFTILDNGVVTGADAGNNFFLESEGIGKNRATEAVRLLGELNDGVEGIAATESLESVLKDKQDWLKGFTLIIAHNVDSRSLDKLSEICWEEEDGPTLIVVRTAGYLAEFFLQYREHTSTPYFHLIAFIAYISCSIGSSHRNLPFSTRR